MAKRKEREWRRLPDGKLTKSLAKYLKEWKEIYEVIERNYGLRIGGFDPGFLFFEVTEACTLSNSISIPIWMARKMVAVAERAESGDACIEEQAGASL